MSNLLFEKFDNKSNQSVVSQAKEQVVQTKKENIQQPVVKIDENTQFDETILPTQDFTMNFYDILLSTFYL